MELALESAAGLERFHQARRHCGGASYARPSRGQNLLQQHRPPGCHLACEATSRQASTAVAFQPNSRVDARPAEPAARPVPHDQGYSWAQQWYPVAFIADLIEGRPERIWLFDEAIAVLRRPGQETLAYVDRCPHRAAALSEGRMTASGHLQCAYHGWTFGRDGSCLNIPQVNEGGATAVGRACATALPCMDYQGMTWVCPSPGTPPPADSMVGLPELDTPGWVADDFVRDMPLDYTLLVENLSDPDHGVFAHQTATFDSFAASSAFPMKVTTEPGKAGDKIVARVIGVLKLTGKDEKDRQKAMMSEEGDSTDITSTLEFEPPCMVRWSRFDKEGNTRFITAFYAIPAGIGRTRLMVRYARNITPWLRVPKWLMAIALNGFLDQDTFLVYSQQATTLGAELEAAQRIGLTSGRSDQKLLGPAPEGSPPAGAMGLQRRKLYCHRSPTDHLLVAIGRWMDDAVPHMPNRYRGLQGGHLSGAAAAALAPSSREVVLDRWACHTLICPSSMRAYNTCCTLRNILAGIAGIASISIVAGVAAGTQSLTWGLFWAALNVSGVAASAAALDKVAKQYTFVYTPAAQAKDLKKIPNLVADK